MESVDRATNKKLRTAAWLLTAIVAAGAIALGAYFRPWDKVARHDEAGAARNGETIPTAVVTIPIEGMTCASCVASVKRAVTALEGVAQVDVDLAEKRARVRYVEGKTSAESISKAISELGYKPGTPVLERGG